MPCRPSQAPRSPPLPIFPLLSFQNRKVRPPASWGGGAKQGSLNTGRLNPHPDGHSQFITLSRPCQGRLRPPRSLIATASNRIWEIARSTSPIEAAPLASRPLPVPQSAVRSARLASSPGSQQQLSLCRRSVVACPPYLPLSACVDGAVCGSADGRALLHPPAAGCWLLPHPLAAPKIGEESKKTNGQAE
ncbi:hypothetical protein CC78DRAFT_615914 [Lojkania enalia]|uniref:Uncharacterized protein n=1 Tax=Lojkania enalia TaxID=147567 RepID=A0A9P4N520_9PLEO|nr:hypothetical protein CC78DRAFT_615914 [Didymosphaeria enalia]